VQQAQAIFAKRCGFCHRPQAMQGRSARHIRAAMVGVPRMRWLAQRLGPGEVELLGAWLTGKLSQPRQPTAKAVAPRVPGYPPVSDCLACHPEHVAQWQPSMHALAHTDPVYDAYFVAASKESGQALESFCAPCHTPVGVAQGSIPFATPPQRVGDTKLSPQEQAGVQCAFCHRIEGYSEPRNGKYKASPAGPMLGAYPDSRSPFHESAASPLYRKADHCGPCHQVVHPANGLVLEDTWGEWQRGPWAAKGVTCQDCHMRASLGPGAPQAGQAALGGPRREHVSEHRFVGPNLMFAQRGTPDGRALEKASRALLRKAAAIVLQQPRLNDGRLEIPLRVENRGAGHSIPTGVTELRQVWLEVRVTDETGAELLSTGKLDERGRLPEGTVIYTTVVADALGKTTTRFWNAVRKVSDRRLPAGGGQDELFVAALGKRQAGQVTVEAILRYRSLSPAGLEEVGTPGLVEIPVLEMTRAKRTFSLAEAAGK